MDQLLDVSRVISGKITLQTEPVDMREVVATTVESLQYLFDARQQALRVHLPSAEEAMVQGDAVRLGQVVENLLGNANKYTEPGGNIWVELAAGDEVTLHVRDDGIGISADLLPRVFDAFAQEPRALGRSQGGLGLGLPLVKGIVELHSGSARAFSEGIGQGADVVITLPRLHSANARANGEPLGGAHAGPTPPRRVLLIEDEADVGETLQASLQRAGHEVHWVGTGAAGVTSVQSFQPDVVFVDIGLPDIDGYEVARQIRRVHSAEEVRLVALTGYGRDLERLAEVGIDDHVLKPPSEEQLDRCLAGARLAVQRAAE